MCRYEASGNLGKSGQTTLPIFTMETPFEQEPIEKIAIISQSQGQANQLSLEMEGYVGRKVDLVPESVSGNIPEYGLEMLNSSDVSKVSSTRSSRKRNVRNQSKKSREVSV